MQMEYKELAEESGIKEWERVPTLGLEPDFISDLAEAVVEALPRTAKAIQSDINEGRPVTVEGLNFGANCWTPSGCRSASRRKGAGERGRAQGGIQ